MNKNFTYLNKEIFDKLNLEYAGYKEETESQEYDACQFQLNKRNIISRSSKVTPKKIGQFVTFWKRSSQGPIEPFSELDTIDYFMITTKVDEGLGLFLFPKQILIKKGILSTKNKDGKRGFRVYPPWDEVKSKQAERTQKWQQDYFYSITNSNDLLLLEKVFRISLN
ncbi:hypothetical protein SAMN04489761_2938 [Tenacibaculum sp. MAR_2009_124]|uniref:MepB family protein n=1 Tax=Tenacibaculum sp. MAR_2009_124 TaxID=1250059 RepID=UPI00089D613C|nr:MepB family protein [Tenacibaculum sp. MAR_2009_124]SEC41829.1 hypothetical protein SAMN04489761_2938 [Tenacibaculum sp. MAR_2009_124]